MPTAYDLLSKAGAIVATLDSPEGGDPDTIDAAIAEFLDASDDKLGALWAANARLKGEDDILAAVADRVASRRKYLTTQRGYIAEKAVALLEAQEALGGEAKVKRPEFSAWLQATASVIVPDRPDDIPEPFRRLRIEADKVKIGEVLKAGGTVPGCSIQTTRGVRWR